MFLFRISSFLILIFFAQNAFSQKSEKIQVRGVVKDALSQEILPYFPFKLYHTTIDTSNFLGDYISNETGLFLIDIAKYDKIIWLSNSALYNTLKKEISPANTKAIDFGDIFLHIIEGDTIQAIEVKTAKMSNDGQKVVFNVGSMGFPENMETAMILQMTPMLSKGQDGGYKFQGVKDVVFYLDGQRSTIETIRSLPSEIIDRIEIVPNPSLYEISGKAALVNVITKTNIFISKGSINGGVGLLRSLYSGNLNFVMKNKKTMLNFTMGASQIKLQGDWQLERRNLFSNTNTLYQNGTNHTNTLSQNANLSFFHNFNSTWKLNGQAVFFQNQPRTNNSLFVNHLQSGFLFRSFNQSERRDPLGSFTSELKKVFSKKFSSSLAFNASLKKEHSQFINNNTDTLSLTNINDTKLQQWAVQWLNQWKFNPSNKLEIGFIYASLNSTSNFRANLFNLQDGSNNLFVANTGFLNFNQQVSYGFVNYNFLYKSWVFHIEGRAEYTNNSIIVSNNNENRSFWNFLPRITITKDLNNYGNLSLVYNRRIYRPETEALNPFTAINNPSFNLRGNNNLLNEIENDLSLNYSLSPNDNSYFDVSLSYNRLDRAKVYRTFAINDTTMERSYQNVNFYDETKLNIAYNTTLNEKLNFNFNNYLSFFSYNNSVADNKFKQGLFYQIDFSASYIFPKKWIAFFSISYLTRDMSFQEYKERLPLLYWSVSKPIFKEKINLSLGIGDIFNWNGRIKTFYNDLNFEQKTRNNLNFRYIDFSLRYNFGKNFQDMRKASSIRL